MFLVDNGLGILANPEDDNLLDIQDQMGGVLVAPGLQSGLVQTPSALNRWMEEAIILDADSIHDCISALKPEVLVIVEKQRDEELAERRERRKKQQEEEAMRRKKEEEEREKNKEATASTATTASTTVPPPVIGTSTTTSVPPLSQQSVTMDVVPSESVPAPSETATGAPAAETPSFSSFFHGFSMQAAGQNSAPNAMTPVRPQDHAESLATSIVEAVLGPALETVSNRALPANDSVRIPPPDIVTNLPATSTAQTPSVFSMGLGGEHPQSTIAESMVSGNAANDGQPIQVDSTPQVERASENQSTTPFNPIPNTTPGAPRPGHVDELSFSSNSTPLSDLRRPLSFQDTSASRQQGSHTPGGMIFPLYLVHIRPCFVVADLLFYFLQIEIIL